MSTLYLGFHLCDVVFRKIYLDYAFVFFQILLEPSTECEMVADVECMFLIPFKKTTAFIY